VPGQAALFQVSAAQLQTFRFLDSVGRQQAVHSWFAFGWEPFQSVRQLADTVIERSRHYQRADAAQSVVLLDWQLIQS
jgi:hypothetical protein